MIVAAEGLTVRYPSAPVAALAGARLTLAPGELVAVVGPNGGGKSTLLRALLGAVPLAAGEITLLGRPLAGWKPRELATVVGAVSQGEETLHPLRVEETVALGRYPHLGPFEPLGRKDHAAVAEAMRQADVLTLAARRTDTLSGGEWQRVRIARALAQEPRLLLLDEPTTALDVGHEMAVLELIRGLVGRGLAALLVTHHLNLAARYADRLVLLHHGAVEADGPPMDVLTPEIITRVFEWPVAVTRWRDGAPQVVPLRPGE